MGTDSFALITPDPETDVEAPDPIYPLGKFNTSLCVPFPLLGTTKGHQCALDWWCRPKLPSTPPYNFFPYFPLLGLSSEYNWCNRSVGRLWLCFCISGKLNLLLPSLNFSFGQP